MISTIDHIIAGFSPSRFFYISSIGSNATGQIMSWWGRGGTGTTFPANGAFGTTLNGTTLVCPVIGQLPYANATAGKQNYLGGFGITYDQAVAAVVMADRIWHNGGYTITSSSPQAITSPAWPARDANGSTAGEGVLLAVEVASTVGAATPTITVTYTNSANVSGRTGTNDDTIGLSSAQQGTFIRIKLQAGDTGVKSVQSLQLSTSWISGTINLVAYRPIGTILWRQNNAWVTVAGDALTLGLPKMYDGSVPFLFVQTQGGQASTYGYYFTVQG